MYYVFIDVIHFQFYELGTEIYFVQLFIQNVFVVFYRKKKITNENDCTVRTTLYATRVRSLRLTSYDGGAWCTVYSFWTASVYGCPLSRSFTALARTCSTCCVRQGGAHAVCGGVIQNRWPDSRRAFGTKTWSERAPATRLIFVRDDFFVCLLMQVLVLLLLPLLSTRYCRLTTGAVAAVDRFDGRANTRVPSSRGGSDAVVLGISAVRLVVGFPTRARAPGLL